MENTNTYKAILLGTILVFGGCLVWLLISRNDLARVNSVLDQSKLKYETLLSEKLLVQKSLSKTKQLLDTVRNQHDLLADAVTETESMLLQEHAKNRRIASALRAEQSKHQQVARKNEVIVKALKTSDDLREQSRSHLKMQTDSISRLTQLVSALQSRLDDAITRSIDQTLIFAEKRNDKITSKARRTKELVAQVELPIELNSLAFSVERPDGTVLSTQATLTARQLASKGSLTASLKDVLLPATKTKKMEIVYKPEKKLDQGLYVFKIFNGSDYVGSMNIQLK